MRNKALLALFVSLTLCWLGYTGVSARRAEPLDDDKSKPTAKAKATPTPPLNTIKIGQCSDKEHLEAWIVDERSHGLVMDARPLAINAATGKLSFNGSTGRVSVVNMNPFIYNYKLTVAQTELVTTALADALKLILPPSLGSLPGLQSGTVNLSEARVITPTKLSQIEKRLEDFEASPCKAPADPLSKTSACIALGEMYEVFKSIRDTGLFSGKAGADLTSSFTTINSPTIHFKSVATNYKQADDAFTTYNKQVAELRDEEADASTTCTRATTINEALKDYNFDEYFKNIEKARKAITQVTVRANDLNTLVTTFNADSELAASKPVIRCKGYNCVGQFGAYAAAALEVLGSYTTQLNTLQQNAQEMNNLYDITEKMRKTEGWFARTSPIIKKFELSQATISLNRTKISQASQTQAGSGQGTQSGSTGTGSGGGGGGGGTPRPSVTGGDSSEGTAGGNGGGSDSATRESRDATLPATEPKKDGANNLAPVGQTSEVVQIGRPRFVLSGGLVYSPLARRTFQSVKGFARDAQGNPTGTGNANVVGYGENSSRRLLPMVLLNSRLLSSDRASLYLSLGVSAKNDNNVDIEYLFGPSVGLLNDRALVTFGIYGGKTQNLVSDVQIGDVLPDTIGDAQLYRKSYTWKPGFSFSYSFSRTSKRSVEGTTGGSSSASDADLSNEIRIGNIPFNLAVGLAYTSLEGRTYDEVVGFARDRQGNLTNGRTLTRIVGLTSSSSYRLTPLALLHSRLTNFGSHDFYFSTGVTGKKTDNAFDIEYLLGGSVNLYQRKVFLTFGAFVGKQQILGGDFFEGAQLGTSQNVTTQNRYVWKPGIAFSYDISRIIKRP